MTKARNHCEHLLAISFFLHFCRIYLNLPEKLWEIYCNLIPACCCTTPFIADLNRKARIGRVTVRQWMTANVVSVSEQASIQEALTLMKHHSIRHLPVVDEQQNLSGWITDADLRGVLIASMLEDLTLKDVMVRNPYTASPAMSLEKAARLILRKRIGGLPVVEDGKLVGVITVVDILSAFINIMGMLEHSSRLDVRASSQNPPLDEITRLIRGHQAEIISICHLIGVGEQTPMYSIRLKKCDLAPILADFQEKGIEVVSAVA